MSLKLESTRKHRLRWGQHTHSGVAHLVGRRLSTSCASSRGSGSELRQPPPAQDQQVNQRPQPHQHRHGHRQPPTETLHFPVRGSRRRRPQPSRRLSEAHLPERHEEASARARPVEVSVEHRVLRGLPPSLWVRVSLTRTLQHAHAGSSASWARLTATCARVFAVNQSAWVLDPPEGLKGGAPPADTRN